MWDPDRLRAAMRAWAAGGPRADDAAALARGLAGDGLRTVVLVEGVSDQAAVETLAARRGRDLAADGVCVVPMGGATSVGRFLRLFGPSGLHATLRGLCDAAEEVHIRRALARCGPLRAGPAEGFFVCVADLEDELIRALGVTGVERVLAAEGDLARFRTFQNQPAQRDRPVPRQLRRFMGTLSGRKARYAAALTTALDEANTPRPLARLLDAA